MPISLLPNQQAEKATMKTKDKIPKPGADPKSPRKTKTLNKFKPEQLPTLPTPKPRVLMLMMQAVQTLT